MFEDEELMNKKRLIICLLLSLILHVALIFLLPANLVHKRDAAAQEKTKLSRQIRIVREEPKSKDAKPEQPDEPEKEPQFAKTNPDLLEKRPEEPDYIGARNSRISGESDQPDKTDGENAPNSSKGVEKDELVTFDQEHEDGPLENEGRKGKAPQPAQPASQPQQASPPAQPLPQQQAQPIRPTSPDKDAERDKDGEISEQPKQEKRIKASNPYLESSDGDLLLSKDPLKAVESRPLPLKMVQSQPLPQTPARPQAKRPLYDPSFAPSSQPGMRTSERRSRQLGRFVFGSKSSLNVSATARGRYEALIYRRVSYYWYAACDEHRGDIVPGSIAIRLIINERGQITDMEIMRRRGASLSQQSFTLKAIRQASIPPIPAEVRADMVGDKIDLIYEFFFD